MGLVGLSLLLLYSSLSLMYVQYGTWSVQTGLSLLPPLSTCTTIISAVTNITGSPWQDRLSFQRPCDWPPPPLHNGTGGWVVYLCWWLTFGKPPTLIRNWLVRKLNFQFYSGVHPSSFIGADRYLIVMGSSSDGHLTRESRGMLPQNRILPKHRNKYTFKKSRPASVTEAL